VGLKQLYPGHTRADTSSLTLMSREKPHGQKLYSIRRQPHFLPRWPLLRERPGPSSFVGLDLDCLDASEIDGAE
jgi:hypothetical protein